MKNINRIDELINCSDNIYIKKIHIYIYITAEYKNLLQFSLYYFHYFHMMN